MESILVGNLQDLFLGRIDETLKWFCLPNPSIDLNLEERNVGFWLYLVSIFFLRYSQCISKSFEI